MKTPRNLKKTVVTTLGLCGIVAMVGVSFVRNPGERPVRAETPVVEVLTVTPRPAASESIPQVLEPEQSQAQVGGQDLPPLPRTTTYERNPLPISRR